MDRQKISDYCLSTFPGPEKFRIAQKPFDFEPGLEDIISFRYSKIEELTEEELSFPIDRYV